MVRLPTQEIPVGYDLQKLNRPPQNRTELDSTDTPGIRTNGSRSPVGKIVNTTAEGLIPSYLLQADTD